MRIVGTLAFQGLIETAGGTPQPSFPNVITASIQVLEQGDNPQYTWDPDFKEKSNLMWINAHTGCCDPNWRYQQIDEVIEGRFQLGKIDVDTTVKRRLDLSQFELALCVEFQTTPNIDATFPWEIHANLRMLSEHNGYLQQ